MIKKAPKTKLKATIKMKAKNNLKTRPTTDAMIELCMLMFMNSLAEEARTKAFQEKSATIRAHHVRAVAKVKAMAETLVGPAHQKRHIVYTIKSIFSKMLKKVRG